MSRIVEKRWIRILQSQILNKVSQVNCLEMAEIEEQDSSFSSINDNHSNCRNIRNEISDVLNKTTTTQNFRVKSPAYCKRSAAELKVKESILNWYTKKAQSVLRELKQMRHQKAHSCSSNRHSLITNKNSMWKELCNDGASPYRTLHNCGLSTPSEFSPFKTHHIRPSANSLKTRRTRQFRNTIKEFKGTINDHWSGQKTETTAKSIQSIKVYKGPVAKAYSINAVSVYPNNISKVAEPESTSKNNSSLLIEPKNHEPKRNFTLLKLADWSPVSNQKSLRNSAILKNYTKQISSIGLEKPIELYKASSLLPGTSNLRISQDIPKNFFCGNYSTLESPFSSSTRSSMKRVKLIENPISNFSTTIHKRTTVNAKTRNFDGCKTANQSIKLLTTKKPVQKQIK